LINLIDGKYTAKKGEDKLSFLIQGSKCWAYKNKIKIESIFTKLDMERALTLPGITEIKRK